MIMRLFGVLAVLGLISAAPIAATAQPAMSPMSLPPSMRPAKKVTVRYLCSGLRVTAVYDNVKDRVSFVWGAKDNHLPHVTSADGIRYANSTIEWWEKGNNVTLSTMPEHTVLATCTAL
jgi:membrane-bound inhibitor of C-type lysozyme